MKKSLMIIFAAMIFIALFSTSCKLEDIPAAPYLVTPSPAIMATPMTTPTVTPEPTPIPTLTPSPEPTPSPTPMPSPTYAPPTVQFDGYNINIGDGWITATLPNGFETCSLTDGELFTAYYMGDHEDGVYSIQIFQTFTHTPSSYAIVRRLDEYLAHIQYQDATVTRLDDDLTFGSAEGYHSVVEGYYQVDTETCHMLVALTEESYYVLYVYSAPDSLLKDDAWMEPIIESFHIDSEREEAMSKERYIAYDDVTRILKTEFAPCQITLPEGWHNAPINRFLNSRIIMAGEHMDGNKVFNVYQFRNDANPYKFLDVGMEQFMLTDRMIALSNNGLIGPDAELIHLPADNSDNSRHHYLMRPKEDFVIAFAILEGEETSYLLELWSYTTDIMTDEALLELLNTFTFDIESLPTQDT